MPGPPSRRSSLSLSSRTPWRLHPHLLPASVPAPHGLRPHPPRPHLDSESSLGSLAAGSCAPRLSQLELFSMARELEAAAPSAAACARCRGRSARDRSRDQPRARQAPRPEAAMFPQPALRAGAVGSRAPWLYKAERCARAWPPSESQVVVSANRKISRRKRTLVCQRRHKMWRGLGEVDSRKMRGTWVACGMRGEVFKVFKGEVRSNEMYII